MGKLIRLEKIREARATEKSKISEKVDDVVEDIRELFKNASCAKATPKLELVEDEGEFDEKDFARIMAKIQSGDIKI